MTDEDLAFLTALRGAIRKRNGDPSRVLTLAERTRVQEIAGRYPVTLHNADWGFGIGMSIWAPPSYPGVPVERVIVLSGRHLLDSLDKDRDHFQRGWKFFSPIALKAQNLKWCAFYGLEAPIADASYYAY